MAEAKRSTHLLVSHNESFNKEQVSGILHWSPGSGVLKDENITACLASTCKGPKRDKEQNVTPLVAWPRAVPALCAACTEPWARGTQSWCSSGSWESCRGSTLRHPHIFSEYCSPFSNSSMKTEIVIWMNDGTDELHPLLKSWPSISSLNAFSSGFQSLDEFYDIYQDWADGEVSLSLQDRLDVASAPRAGWQGGIGSQLGLDGLKGLFQLQLFCDPVNWTVVPSPVASHPELLCSALGSPTVTAAPSWFPSLSSCAHFPPENIDLSLCMFSSTWALLVSIPGQSLFSEHPQKHVPLRALISNGVLQNRCS